MHARNIFADLEDATEAELDAFQREFAQLRQRGHRAPEAADKATQLLDRRHLRGNPPVKSP